MPTCGDYIMHFLTLFWKVLFAFIPPAGKLKFFLINNSMQVPMRGVNKLRLLTCISALPYRAVILPKVAFFINL